MFGALGDSRFSDQGRLQTDCSWLVEMVMFACLFPGDLHDSTGLGGMLAYYAFTCGALVQCDLFWSM